MSFAEEITSRTSARILTTTPPLGVDVEVELRRALLDPAQHQMLDRVEADGAQAQGVLHGAVEILQPEALQQPQDRTYSLRPALGERASIRRRRVWNAGGSSHPASGAA